VDDGAGAVGEVLDQASPVVPVGAQGGRGDDGVGQVRPAGAAQVVQGLLGAEGGPVWSVVVTAASAAARAALPVPGADVVAGVDDHSSAGY